MKISMKLAYEYMVIFFTFSLSSNHLYPLQVENCDNNEYDNVKFRLERVNALNPHDASKNHFAFLKNELIF